MRNCGEVRIDVPAGAGLPESSSSQSSAGSQLLALRRILSMGRKSTATMGCEFDGIGELGELGSASG